MFVWMEEVEEGFATKCDNWTALGHWMASLWINGNILGGMLKFEMFDHNPKWKLKRANYTDPHFQRKIFQKYTFN